MRENRRNTRPKFAALQPRVARGAALRDAGGRVLPVGAHADRRRRVRAARCYAEENVTVLPGSYLARDAHGTNPGRNRIRIALVADAGRVRRSRRAPRGVRHACGASNGRAGPARFVAAGDASSRDAPGRGADAPTIRAMASSAPSPTVAGIARARWRAASARGRDAPAARRDQHRHRAGAVDRRPAPVLASAAHRSRSTGFRSPTA